MTNIKKSTSKGFITNYLTMNNEFLKGVLDAKLSRLLTESDYETFFALPNTEQLAFFLNNNLVTTNIVTNFEALCQHAQNDLKDEIINYLGKDHIYVKYFFSQKRQKDVSADYLNKLYESVAKQNDEWLRAYLDLEHSVLNVMLLLRGSTQKDVIKDMYLVQQIMSAETYHALLNSDRGTIFSYIKNTFNVDLESDATNREVEAKLDEYKLSKLKDLAVEGELAPTIIYYIKMKEYEIFRLRMIYHTKRNTYA